MGATQPDDDLLAGDPVWRTADEIALLFDVKLSTVWAWRRRGHITAVNGRYDLREVLRWHEQDRDVRMDAVRLGVARPRQRV